MSIKTLNKKIHKFYHSLPLKYQQGFFIVGSLLAFLAIIALLLSLKAYFNYQRSFQEWAELQKYDFNKPVPSDPLISYSPEIFKKQTEEPTLHLTDPHDGDLSAPIIIHEYSNFNCKPCAELNQIITELKTAYPQKILHTWKDHFDSKINPQAQSASLALHCTNQQKHFADYQEQLFTNQQNLNEKTYYQLAKDLDLNSWQFKRCFKKAQTQNIIDLNLQEAHELGLSTIPTLFINNKKIIPPFREDEIGKVVEKILEATATAEGG